MFPLYQASGFYCAPVSKGLVGSSVLASLAVSLFPFAHHRHWFQISPSTIFDKKDAWKYLACRSVFTDPKDILCAGVILYHFRVFERRYGSLKFASYLLCTMFLSLLIEVAVLSVMRAVDLDLGRLPTGPFGVLYALFIPYFCDIPRVAYTHVMGVPVTGKSFTYVIGLQMASGAWESAFLAGLGLMAGLLYRANVLWVQRWLRVPRLVGVLCDVLLGRLLQTPSPQPPGEPMGATLEIQRQQQIERLEQQMAWADLQPQPRFGLGFFGARNGANRARRAPSEDQVQRLVEMGFTRDRVMHALQASDNDVNVATNLLLHQT